MHKILLQQAEVLTAEGQVITADIAVENQHIQYIDNIPAEWQAERVIDCRNLLAVPGFVNTHTHAAMTLFRSYADDMQLMDWLQQKIWPAEANLTADDVYWGTMLAAAEMIKSGTTTFADMYFFMPEVAKAVSDSGMRAVLARGMAGVAPTAEAALVESDSFFREYHRAADGRISVMLGPHAPYTCPPEYLRRVVNLAQRLDAEIHIHLSETIGEVEDCQKQYGKSPIALMAELGVLDCGVLAAHCVHVSNDDIMIMQEKKVRVAHNPGSNMKLASGIAPVPAMLEAGLCVGLGTDGAASNNNLDMLEELRLAAMLHKVHSLNPLVVPAKQAVEMATVQGAKALGLGNTVGVLAPGYKADITLFNMQAPHWYPRHDRLSLLTYAANAADVQHVMIDGRMVLVDKQLTTMDEEKVLYEAQQRGMRLIK